MIYINVVKEVIVIIKVINKVVMEIIIIVCECDEQFTSNNCQYTFQTCGDTDHNNPDNIRPFNCGNKGTLKQYPFRYIM